MDTSGKVVRVLMFWTLQTTKVIITKSMSPCCSAGFQVTCSAAGHTLGGRIAASAMHNFRNSEEHTGGISSIQSKWRSHSPAWNIKDWCRADHKLEDPECCSTLVKTEQAFLGLAVWQLCHQFWFYSQLKQSTCSHLWLQCKLSTQVVHLNCTYTVQPCQWCW